MANTAAIQSQSLKFFFTDKTIDFCQDPKLFSGSPHVQVLGVT
jgi:hypothetical protein